jgi:DNA invertase Pin-like site-specific DNA recombinase
MSDSMCAASAPDCRKEESMKQKKITVMYERLSRDDGDKAESDSIAHQKILLAEYATQHGFPNPVHITDDGISGLRFDDRPGYVKMMEEVENGNVFCVLVKDITRLGRDYIRVGICLEELRKSNVRFIALGDGIDTLKGEDDFTPFRAVMAEFYAKDTSRKIKSAYKAKSASGKHTSSCPPYGYLKDANDKHKWVVDEDAAAIVRRIFQMTMDGLGPYQICCALKEGKVEIPGYHLAQRGAGLHQRHVFPDPYNWNSSCVCAILRKKEYLGHTVNFKTRKHFKDAKSHYVDESQWTIIENTHAPIIDQETFDNVQRIRNNIKRRPDGWGYIHPLSGLLYCADCNGKLHIHRVYNGKDKPTAVCGNYAKGSAVIRSGIVCESGHRIDAGTVMGIVHDTLKGIVSFAQTDRAAFEKAVKESLSEQQTTEVKKQSHRLAVGKKRAADLETLLRKIYEDNALGKLPDKRYQALSTEYETEQAALENEIAGLQAAVSAYERGGERAARFIALVKRYQDFEDIGIAMLNEFVERIVIFERDRKGCQDANQRVDIYLNFIGAFSVPKEEIDPAVLAAREEEERMKLERREKLHQAYLQRKANGKQQEWEQSYNERRRKNKARAGATLYAEGAVLGANAAGPFAASAL